MKRVAKFLLILSILPIFAWAESEDYFDRVTVYSDGKITRFTTMPITVYVEPVSILPESGGTFLDDLKHALREWELCSEGKIKFEITEKLDDVDIRVSLAKQNLTERMDNRLGDAQLVRKGNDFDVMVKLSLRQKGSGELISHKEMRAVCLHEFGHAIGLWGHSPTENDVMFFAVSGTQHLTERDKNTLLKVYSHELNHPQHEQALSILKKQVGQQPSNPKLHYLIGSVYLDKGDYEQAIEAFNGCLKSDPSYTDADERLVQAYLQLDRNDEAIQQYEKLLRQNPSAELYNSMGGIYYKQKNIDRAIEYFEEALKIDSRYRPARDNLFNICRERGNKFLEGKNYDAAIADFSQAIEISPTNSDIYDLIGAAYSEKEDYEKAIGYFRKAISLNPGNDNAKTNLAKSYNNWGVKSVNQGNFQSAIDAHSKALKITPGNDQFKNNLESAYWRLANYYTQKKEHGKAIETYQHLLKFGTTNKELHCAMAGAYYELGRYSEAIESFETALQIDKEDAETKQNLFLTHCKYGQVLIEQRNYREAIVPFQAALEINTDDTNTLINLGVAYERSRQFDQALATYEKVIALDPDNDMIRESIINLHINQGNRFMQASKYKAAIAEFVRISEKDRSADISSLIGYLYVITNRPIVAIPHLERALEKNPNDKTSYQNLRSIESDFDIEAGESRKLDKNKSSQKIKEDLALTRCSLAKVLMYRKNLPSAKAKLRQALDLAPQSPGVKKAMIETCIKMVEAFQAKKWPKNAKEVARWALELEPKNETAKKILGQEGN